MVNSTCSVRGCINRGGHRFPKNVELRNKWLVALNIINWQPSNSSVVCASHFKKEDYHEKLELPGKNGEEKSRFVLKKNSLPCVNLPYQKPNREGFNDLPNDTVKYYRPKKKKTYEVLGNSQELEEIEHLSSNQRQVKEASSELTFGTKSTSIQTDNIQTPTVSQSVQTEKIHGLSVEQFTTDKSGLHFYTGLESYEKFIFVFQTLGEAAFNLQYIYGNPPTHITVINQFFLTLIRLRRGRTYFELKTLFNINDKAASNIFITWVRFMSLQWREVPLWTSRELVQFYTPLDFGCKYPLTRLIIDGTECPIRKPSLPTAQQCTFSTYKNRNTIKVLVGASPGGLITYMSPSYGGSTSDRQIIERSDIVRLCNLGDSIMSDKGFNVQDIFAPYGIKVNTPAFFKKSNRIQGSTIYTDRKIASKRVHIERRIGLMKTYKILQSPLLETETILSEDIVFVCAMLTNFRNNIVNRDA